MTTTRAERHIAAAPERVYALLTDGNAVQRWRVPDGMRSHVHAFDARVGGRFRVSLTYDAPDAVGKTQANTDTYHGEFVALEPGRRVVERMAFESDDAAMARPMTVSYTLTPVGDGTHVQVEHADVPDAVSPDDNAEGWTQALDRLAALAESPHSTDPA